MEWVEATQLETVDTPAGDTWVVEVKQRFARRVGGLSALLHSEILDVTWLVTYRRRDWLDWTDIADAVEEYATEEQASVRMREITAGLRRGQVPAPHR